MAGMDLTNVDDGRRISFKHRRSPVGFIPSANLPKVSTAAVKSLVVPR